MHLSNHKLAHYNRNKNISLSESCKLTIESAEHNLFNCMPQHFTQLTSRRLISKPQMCHKIPSKGTSYQKCCAASMIMMDKFVAV